MKIEQNSIHRISTLVGKVISGLLLLALLFGPGPSSPIATVEAADPLPPHPPHTFYGVAQLDGVPAADGAVVEAQVSHSITQTFTISGTAFSQGDQSGLYQLALPADDPETVAYDGGRNGDSVTFRVANAQAAQTAIFAWGETSQLDLTALSVNTPTATATSTATTPPTATATATSTATTLPTATATATSTATKLPTATATATSTATTLPTATATATSTATKLPTATATATSTATTPPTATATATSTATTLPTATATATSTATTLPTATATATPTATAACPREVTSTSDSGPGSLRQAIADVNGLCNHITFAASLSGQTIHLASELLVNNSLSIDGAGRRIAISGDTDNNGSGDVPVFTILGGTVTLTHLTIEKAYGADGEGGGVSITSDAQVAISYSTLRDNISDNGSFFSAGGGISNMGILTITNSSLSNNQAANFFGLGGGIYSGPGAATTVRYSTLTNNSAPDGNGGGIAQEGGNVTLIGSIVSGNSASAGPEIDVQYGTFTADGYNVLGESGSHGMAGAIPGTSDGVPTGPVNTVIDSALTNSGGDSDTHGLVVGGPAHNTVPAGALGCGTTIVEDQRGVTRPVGVGCDAGAVESQTAAPPTQVTCSQAELLSAISAGESSGTIDLNGDCTYILTSTSHGWRGGSGAFIFSATQLNGNGATIQRADDAPAFRLLGVQVDTGITIRDLTLRNGNTTDRGGGLIANRNITLENVHFVDNQAADIGGGLLAGQQAIIRNSTFNENRADGYGGGIFGFGNLTVEDSTFVKNQGSLGGAFFLQGGQNLVLDTLFIGNQAVSGSGASIYAISGKTLTVVNSTVTDDAPNSGLAIYGWGPTTVYNSIVTNHYVALAGGGGPDNPVVEDYNRFAANTRLSLMYNSTRLTQGSNSQEVADIRFVDPATGVFSLQPNSPGVDGGNSALLQQYSSLAIDIAGNGRPFGNTLVDVGAFETQRGAVASIAIEKQSPPWVSANTAFVFALTLSNQGVIPASDLAVVDVIPNGAIYVTDSASDGGVYNNRTLTWNIGTLQPGQSKRVEYQATASQNLSSNDYRAYSISDPLVIATGPAVNTPLNTAIVASLGFFPDPDGFGFHNWGKPNEETDLMVEDMVLLFGDGVCVSGSNPCVLNPGAQSWRDKKINPGGHCFGMAVTSMRSFLDLPFKNMTQPGDFQPGVQSVFDLTRDQVLRNYITFYHVTQSTSPVDNQGFTFRASDGTPADFLDKLIANLNDTNAADRYVAGFHKRGGGVGHAATPYAVEEKGGGVFWIHVYDNNHPNNYQRMIKIDRNANTWVYEGATVNPNAPPSAWEGDATTKSLRLLSTANSGNTLKKCKFCTPSGRANDETGTEVTVNGEGRLLVTDSQGRRVGYDPVTGEWVNEIDGAEQNVVYLGLGEDTPPEINLPGTGPYTVQVFNNPEGLNPFESTSDLLYLSTGFAASVGNMNLDSPPLLADDTNSGAAFRTSQDLAATGYDTLNVTFDPDQKRVIYRNSSVDDDTPSLSLEITNPDGTGISVVVDNLQLGQSRSAALAYDPTQGTVAVENNDSTINSYGVQVVRTNTDGSQDSYQATLTDGEGVGVSLHVGSDWDGKTPPKTESIQEGTLLDAFSKTFLPILSWSELPKSGPDLVVDAIRPSASGVEVVIKNQGDTPVVDEFWVDLYLDPTTTPTAVNQLWQNLGEQGAVWGVTSDMLPLQAGGTLALSLSDPHLSLTYSNIGGPLPAGARLFAQVDSWNGETSYGAVLEGHEQRGGAYNNITGPVTLAREVFMSSIGEAQAATPGHGGRLPVRLGLLSRSLWLPAIDR